MRLFALEWKPIIESEIKSLITAAADRMEIKPRRLWEQIKIEPVKWQQHPWGDEGGGFWAVAVFGQTALWYNDIEEGFNRSTYTNYGVIDQYWCNQDQLEWVLHHVHGTIETGQDQALSLGPPMPLTD